MEYYTGLKWVIILDYYNGLFSWIITMDFYNGL